MYQQNCTILLFKGKTKGKLKKQAIIWKYYCPFYKTNTDHCPTYAVLLNQPAAIAELTRGLTGDHIDRCVINSTDDINSRPVNSAPKVSSPLRSYHSTFFSLSSSRCTINADAYINRSWPLLALHPSPILHRHSTQAIAC